MGFKRLLIFIVFTLLVCEISAFGQDGLEIMVGGKVLKSGGEWFTPMNSASNKVALFSEQREGFSIYNKSSAQITVNKIDLAPDKEAALEEFTLQTADVKPQPLNFQETVIEPGKRFDFYVRYYPVQSKHLGAQVTITYNGSQTYSFRISGKGRDKAIFSGKTQTLVQKLFGGPETDEMVTGMVMDNQGRVFFSGQVTSVEDKFAYDIFYGCILQDNTLAWAKLWSGPFRDYSRDSGQNDETGGTANAIGLDVEGFIYLTGSVSPSKTNNNYAVLAMKINPDTGEPVWEKFWRPEWPSSLLSKHSAEAYGLDIKDGLIYITGTTGAGVEGSDALVLLLALSTEDGSLKHQYYVDPIPKTNDRGYAIEADEKGNLYLGGLMGKYGLLVKLSAADFKVAWAKEINLGWGSNINCLDTDQEGNVYLSCDCRGANTFFTILKVSPQGELCWGKTYAGSNNKNNNTNIVKVVGDAVYAGGRTGQGWYDAQMGDAKILKLNAADGKELWSAFYFNGKGPDEMCEHRVKGLAFAGDELVMVGQVYSGSLNGVRFWGYWYDGVGALKDYKPKHVKDLGMKPEGAMAIPKGEVRDASGHRKLLDLKERLVWQDADLKHDGKAPDGDLIFWRLKMSN